MAEASIDMWEQRVQVVAPLGRVGVHAHAATALLVSLDGKIGLRWRGAMEWGRRHAWLVPAGTPHELDCGASRVGVSFLAPGPADEAALRERWRLGSGSPGTGSLDRPAQELRELLRCRVAKTLHGPDFESAVTGVLGTGRIHIRPLDPRIVDLVTAVSQRPDLPVSRLASTSRMGLSASRLREVVRAELGTSLQSLRRWQRMRRVTQEFAGGASLTQAAHSAGFCDSAQLSRDFRAAFGVPPTRVLGRGCDVRVHR